jgi:hypothetical protein
MKHFSTLLALLLCVATTSIAQNEVPASPVAGEGCPVDIERPFHHHHLPYGTDVLATFVNKTDKKISAVKFGVILYDDVGDPHEYVYYVSSSLSTKPGKKGRADGLLDSVTLLDGRKNDTRNGMQFYLIKALYSDGSSWVDEGAKKCVSPID